MLEFLRKYAESLSGYTAMTRDAAEKLVGDLAQRGEVRARDAQKLARDLVERSNRNRQELVRLVQKEIKRQIGSLGLATRDDVDRLAKRVRDLERKSKPASRAKTPARKSS